MSTITAPVLLLTINQVAESLQISRRTVESLVASGQLRSITIGSSRRVTPGDLKEFAQKGAAHVMKSGLRRTE